MAVDNYHELKNHVDHDIECVSYGDGDNPMNVALECETCHVVLMDFDHPDADDNAGDGG